MQKEKLYFCFKEVIFTHDEKNQKYFSGLKIHIFLTVFLIIFHP